MLLPQLNGPGLGFLDARYVAKSGAVSSVFGRTGAVVAASGDYTAAQVTNAAAVNVANTFTADQSITKNLPFINLIQNSWDIGKERGIVIQDTHATNTRVAKMSAVTKGGGGGEMIISLGTSSGTAWTEVARFVAATGGVFTEGGIKTPFAIYTDNVKPYAASSVTIDNFVATTTLKVSIANTGTGLLHLQNLSNAVGNVNGVDFRHDATFGLQAYIRDEIFGGFDTSLHFGTATSFNTASTKMTITGAGRVGVGTQTPSSKLHVSQSSTTAAIPVLRLNQADLSEEFIRFESTVGAGNAIDTAALGAYYGKVRVYVEGVGAKWLALYD